MARFGVSRRQRSPARTRERTESSRSAGTRKASAATKSWRTNGSSSPSSGSVAHSRLTKISAIARSYRQSSAQPIRLDRYQALLAATHDRGQSQRHHHGQERHRRATGSAPKRLSLHVIGLEPRLWCPLAETATAATPRRSRWRKHSRARKLAPQIDRKRFNLVTEAVAPLRLHCTP